VTKLEVSLQFRGGGRTETYYQAYIDGEKELRQINEEFRTGLVRG
jgi:hypothetical protein